MRKLSIILGIALAVVMVLAVACGGAAPAPAATATVTKTAPAAPAATVTVTQTVPPATITVTPTPTPAKLVKVTESLTAGSSAAMLATVGKNQGLMAKRGIDHTPMEMTVDAARVAPFLGQTDVSAGDILAFYAERKDVRIIGPQQNGHFSLVVRKDSPYKSYQDLKGKKMGILGPATGQYQMVKTVVKLEGMDLEKDFQLTVGQPAVQIGWLLKSEVEAIHLFEPHTTKLLVSDGDKVREVYWLNDLYKKYSGSNWIFGGIYTSEAWVKKNPDLAKQFGLGYDDIMIYMYAHDQVFKSDLAKKTWQVEDPRVLELLVQRMPGTMEHPPYGPAYKAALVKKTQLIADAGLLPKEAVDWFKGAVLFAD